MGCIIDWTAVLKAPQIVQAVRQRFADFRPKSPIMDLMTGCMMTARKLR
jgi:hypothetical protein